MTEPASPPSPDVHDPDARREHKLARVFGSQMMWSTANNFATNLVTMFVFIFLTYQLEPAVFGIFALGVIIVDYFNFQARSACIDACVQRRYYSPLEMDSAFWAMMAVTVVVIVICGFAGLWLAQANDLPSLAVVMPVLALTLLPVPLQVPTSAIMGRDYDFKGNAIRTIISVAAGGVAAIAAVFMGAPEWALVAQRGVQVTATSAFSVLRVRWWPGFSFSLPLAAGFLKDAGRIFAAQAIASSQMRVLDLVVAFGFGATAVGLMRIASRFVEMLLGTFVAPISSLWVLLLSEKGKDRIDRDLIYRRLSQMSAIIALPMFAGLALCSEEVIAVTLASDYAPAASLLSIFCLVGLFSPVTYFRNAAMIAVKRLNLLITYSVLDVVVVIIAALLLMRYSVEAVVASLLILEIVRVALTVPLLLKEMKTKASALFLAMLPAYAATAVMAAAVFAIDVQAASFGPWIQLALKISTGGFAYVGYLLIFHRKWSMTAINMLRPQKRETVLAPAAAGAAG
jgi:teichuronic acid exporter